MSTPHEHPWLQRLSIKGDSIESAKIEFSPGLTLIHGRSDTGKTYLADAIDYIFTAASKPFDKDTGYTDIVATFQTPQGKLTVNRPLAGSKAIISADNPAITPGTYSITSSDKSLEASLSDILLAQIGIHEPRKILTSAYQASARLTVRRFADVFYLSENSVFDKRSIFQPGSTDTLTALAVLLFDTSFEHYQQKEDLADQQKRQAYMHKYLDKRVDDIQKEIAAQARILEAFKGRDMEAEYARAQETIANTTAAINDVRAEMSEITKSQIQAQKDRCTEAEKLKNYRILEQRYLARIERLGLVTDAQTIHETEERLDACPFCHGELPDEIVDDYRQAVAGETSQAVAHLKGLQEAINDVNANIAYLDQKIEALDAQHCELKAIIDVDYRPAQQAAQAILLEYPIYQKAASSRDSYENLNFTLTNDMHEITHELPATGDFKPRALFPPAFFTEMTENCAEILHYCGYSKETKIDFNREDFDLRVNNKPKRSHGKGYRAFFNTVVLMALRKYVHEHAAHKPFLCMIDTPTLGLDSKPINDGLVTKRNKDARPIDGLQAKLFQYFINTQHLGQLIIVDNTKDTPALNYAQDGGREYVFTAAEERIEISETAIKQYGLLPALVPEATSSEENQQQ